jgi:hypothetical protein
MAYLSALVATRPDASTFIANLDIVSAILNPLMTGQLRHASTEFTGLQKLMSATLQMLLTVLEWTNDSFRDLSTITALTKLKSFLEEPEWEAERYLIDRLLLCASQHSPFVDHYSRRLDSAAEYNEAAVMKSLDITEFATHYCSIGDSLLLSFLEKPDDSVPLVMVARGPFGKAAWVLHEDYRGGLSGPEISDEIQPEELPRPTEKPVQAIKTHAEPVTSFSLLSDSFLSGDDRKLRDRYEAAFVKWLNSGSFCPLDRRGPYQRARVVDVLTTLGIVDSQNSSAVRIHDSTAVENVIARFDALDSPILTPILVTHVLPQDNSLRLTPEKVERMTPLMQAFLDNIGEPMIISENVAQARGLPSLKSAVPMFPSFGGFCAIFSPAMLSTQSSVEDFDRIKGHIRLVFNETNLDIIDTDSLEEEMVLVITPVLDELYFVRQKRMIEGRVSPFTNRQVLSAKTLAFYLSVIVEQAFIETATRDLCVRRKELLAELCSGPVVSGLGPILSGLLQPV